MLLSPLYLSLSLSLSLFLEIITFLFLQYISILRFCDKIKDFIRTNIVKEQIGLLEKGFLF